MFYLQIQLSPSTLQALQQQLGSGQQVVVQASTAGGFTPAGVQVCTCIAPE